MVYVWNYDTQQLVYRLPGHKGSVNEVDFHPLEPIGAPPRLTRPVMRRSAVGVQRQESLPRRAAAVDLA